jgi:hypothetical protein
MPTFGEKGFLFCKNITYFSTKTAVSIVDVHTYLYIFFVYSFGELKIQF